MSAKIERKEIEAPAELIADGKSYHLSNLSVAFLPNAEDLVIEVRSDNPVPANTKTLLLSLPSTGIQVKVLREECSAKFAPPDVHFHLKVPDRNHREKIAKFALSDANHPT